MSSRLRRHAEATTVYVDLWSGETDRAFKRIEQSWEKLHGDDHSPPEDAISRLIWQWLTMAIDTDRLDRFADVLEQNPQQLGDVGASLRAYLRFFEAPLEKRQIRRWGDDRIISHHRQPLEAG